MTTLVTGAGGFLGGRIAARLAAMGEFVRGLDIVWPAGAPEGVEAMTGSILDRADLARACDGTRHVIHAAAIADLWTAERFAYDRTNVVGTCLVLAAARRVGARVVHVSSYTTLIAGGTGPDSLLDETVEVVPTRLLGPYPRAKRQAELVVQAAVSAGQSACMVLPTAPIGVGDHNLTPPARLLRDLATGGVPALLDCQLNLVDADAVAEACVAARTAGRDGARYLLAGADIGIGDLAARIAALTGVPAPRRRVPPWVALAAARAEGWLARLTGRRPTAPLTGVRLALHPCRFDAARARADLGFAPRPLDDILPEALASLADRP